MEHKCKKIILSLLILLICGTSYAIDYLPPHDLGTIELLIEMHKRMKDAEQQSSVQNAEMSGIQTLSTSEAGGFNDVKTTIYKKMCDANSYIILATSIVQVCNKLESLTKETYAFETEVAPLVVKKPYTLNRYVDTHKYITKSVDRLQKSIATFTAGSVLNVLKSSMDEKFKLLYHIDATLTELRGAIQSATTYIKYSNSGDYKELYPTDIIPEGVKKTTAQKVAKQWTAKSLSL